jgi:Holliday junction resolvase RusA-like endonuclease
LSTTTPAFTAFYKILERDFDVVRDLDSLNPWHYKSIWLPGRVEANIRARSSGRRVFYDPNAETKSHIRAMVCRQVLTPNVVHTPPRGEVAVRLSAYQLAPKKYRIPEGFADYDTFIGCTWANSKDIDNICKIYMDALNPASKPHPLEGILWRDDCQVNMLAGFKVAVFDPRYVGVYIQVWYRELPMLEVLSNVLHADSVESFNRR